MLKVFSSPKGLNKAQLLNVYEQSIHDAGKQNYAHLPENLQLLNAEKDLLLYIDLFLADKRAIIAVWAAEGAYVAALRAEQYNDGFLLSGLETAPAERHKGYATALVKELQSYLSQTGHYTLYSHVDKKNKASLRVHEKCGFSCILEHAVYLDGSVSRKAYTLCYHG